MSAVYKIVNRATGKLYVGYTTDFRRRMSQHLFRLRAGKHHSKHLQAAFVKYGEAAFDFLLIEECPRDQAVEREQFWIDELKASDPAFGYNKAKKVGFNPGCPHTIEAKRLMAEHRRGRPASERLVEANRKTGAARRGIPRPPEVVARAAAGLVGRKLSEETRRKMSEKMTGFRHTEEAKAKIAAASLGRELSDEAKAKISAFWKGRERSEEQGQKLSEAMKGRFLGAERYNARAVVQCDLEGNVIAIFDSGATASRETGVANPNISKVINGKLSHAGGFVWRRPLPEELAA